jgi:hypothetical protein
MPHLPSLREANWGPALQEFLQVEHHNDGTHKKGAILGDGTAGKKLRCINLSIGDAMLPDTIMCKIDSVFNGDETDWEHNLAKGSYTANFTLDVSGAILTIKASALAGNCVAVIFANIYENRVGITLYAKCYNYFGDIRVLLNEGAVPKDLTTIVDVGSVFIEILYITDA